MKPSSRMICRSLHLCPLTYNIQITESQLFRPPECKQEYHLLFAITDVYYSVSFLIATIAFWQWLISPALISKICPPLCLPPFGRTAREYKWVTSQVTGWILLCFALADVCVPESQGNKLL